MCVMTILCYDFTYINVYYSTSFSHFISFAFFFFNDTATTEIYTLSLHDALPILGSTGACRSCQRVPRTSRVRTPPSASGDGTRSEEHTSELQSRPHLVCRLLLEKKKKKKTYHIKVLTSRASNVQTCSGRRVTQAC